MLLRRNDKKTNGVVLMTLGIAACVVGALGMPISVATTMRAAGCLFNSANNLTELKEGLVHAAHGVVWISVWTGIGIGGFGALFPLGLLLHFKASIDDEVRKALDRRIGGNERAAHNQLSEATP